METLLGIVLFGMFLAATGLTILHGQENTALGGDRVRATQAVSGALEAARIIRDASFAGLSAGTHGYAVDESGNWSLNGSAVVLSGGYITSLAVTPLAADWVRLTANVRWKHGYNRSGSVLITSELTDWRTTRPTGDWSGLNMQGSYVPGGTIDFNAIAVAGNYAFVTSETAGGGAGLYVLDISSLSAPVRVASSFSLGAAGYGVMVKGKILYVITADASQEIRAYDITAPASLSAADLRTSFNLSGSSLATSLAINGSTLLVGAQQDATYAELYAFDISNSGAIVARGTLQDAATVHDVGTSGTGVFLATSDSTGEFKEVQLSATGGLFVPAVSLYNLTSTEAGRSVAVSGTSAVLGRLRGTSIQELVLLNTRQGGGSPPPSPGPWYHEGSGSIVGLEMDASTCYAFLAADSSGKAVQVVELHNTALPEAASYNSVSGPARGLFYDNSRDRLFVSTRQSMLIFQPGGGFSSCL